MFKDVDNEEIRGALRRLCERFPGEYWRKLDADRAYPLDFVDALTGVGYLATLIPEEYSGSRPGAFGGGRRWSCITPPMFV